MISSKSDYEIVDWSKLDSDAECNGTIIPIEDASTPPKDPALRTEDFAFLYEAVVQRYNLERSLSYIRQYVSAPTPSKDTIKDIIRYTNFNSSISQPREYLKGSTPFDASGWTSVPVSNESNGYRTWIKSILGSSNFVDTSIIPTATQIDALEGFDANIMRRFYRYILGENNSCPWWCDERALSRMSTDYGFDSSVINKFRYWGSSYYKSSIDNGDYTFSFDLSMSQMVDYYAVNMKAAPYPNSAPGDFYVFPASGDTGTHYLEPVSLNVRFGTRVDYAQDDIKVVMYASSRPNQTVQDTTAYAKIFTPTRVDAGTYQILDFFSASDLRSILGANRYASVFMGLVFVRDRRFTLPPGTNWTWQPS